MLGSDVTDAAMFEWAQDSAPGPWHLVQFSNPEVPSIATACGTEFLTHDQRPTSDLPWPVAFCGGCRAIALKRTEDYVG